jgi:hypothetical protein
MVTLTTVGAPLTIVRAMLASFRATLTIVAEPQTIFCVTRKIVAAIMKTFSFGQTMFCGI